MERFQRTRVGAVLMAGVLLAACGGSSGSDPLTAAEKQIARKDLPAAVVELKTLLVKEPNSVKGRYLLGSVLLEQGQAVAALTELNKAIELGNPSDALLGKHAKALLANGRYNELLTAYEKVSLTEPVAQAEVRTAVAIAQIRLDQFQKGIASLEEALKANPKAGWPMITLARVALSKGQNDEAARHIDAAIATNTINGEGWHVKGAYLQLIKNDLVAAEAAYKEAAKDQRFGVQARGALISLYISQKRTAELKALHEELRKLYPKSPITTLVDAQISYLEGKLDAARERLDQLLKLAPNDARLLIFSGGVDLARGALLPAEAQLGKAIQSNEHGALARRLLGETYIRMGQPDKALATLRPTLEAGQPDAETLALAGEAHLQLGDPRKAEALLAAAVKLKPDDAKLRTAVALTDLVKGRTQDAFDALQQIASADPSDIADKAMISARMNRREYDQALEAVDRLDKKKPGQASVVMQRGLILRAKGDAAGARAALEAAIKLEPSHYAATAALADLEFRDGRFDAARQRMEAAVKADPKSMAARITLASLLDAMGAKTEDVRAVYSAAITAAPQDTAPRVALINYLLARRDSQAALNAARDAQAAFPGSAEVLEAAGRAQSVAGDDQQAISTFSKLANITPRSPMAHIRLADVHGKRRDLTAASASLRRAFEIAPESDDVHRRMLALGKLAKDPSLALTSARELQKKRPDSAVGWFVEGDAEAGRGNWAAAIAAFKGAVGKPDARGRAQVRVYDAFLASKQAPAADKWAADWMKANPGDSAFIEHVAESTSKRGNKVEAERLYAKAVAVNPRSALALNNLAWIQIARSPSEAVANAEKALALAPGSPPIMDTLALALAAQKQYPRAIELLKQAVVTGNDPDYFRLNLAKVLAASGDKAQALELAKLLESRGDRFAGSAAAAALRKSIEGRK